MPTWTALTTLPDSDKAEALGAALEALEPEPTGVGIFELEDGSGLWEVGGYFSVAPDVIALSILAAAHGARPFAVSDLPETDWVAHVRRELHPVEAGRFFVYGSHDAAALPADRIGLLIEAAMAFGTGHHGTTKGCLDAFAMLLTDDVVPRNVADIGCGTAVLAIAAAKATDAAVVASDIDPQAVEVACANAAANGVGGRVACLEAAGFAHPELARNAPFDLVFANILKGPLIDLAPMMATHVAPAGHVILSGILIAQADEVTAAYHGVGFCLRDRREIGDWATLTLRR